MDLVTNSSNGTLFSLDYFPIDSFGVVGYVFRILSMIDWSNQFTTGGITLAILGTFLATLKMILNYIVEAIKRDWIITAEFSSENETFSWLMAYLADHPSSRTSTRFSVVSDITRPGDRRSESELLEASATGFGTELLPQVYYLPNPGDHIIRYRKHFLYLNRHRLPISPEDWGGQPKEVISISAFGSRSIIEQLVTECQKKWIETEKGRTVIYSADQYGGWRRMRSRPIRPLSTIVLDRGVKNLIVRDAIEFLKSEKWYGDRGIPYRRGYLFHGYPGTGKTSIIAALAGHLRFNIYVISLSNRALTDDNLVELMSLTPPHCILLLEDVDVAFKTREKESEDKSKGASGGGSDSTSRSLTFSGLLNAIDGVAAQEGRILCMTTNHIDRLDPALIRPGRIDVRVLFDRASKWQSRQLFRNFFSVGDVPTSSHKLDSLDNEEEEDDEQPASTPDLEKEPELLTREELYSLAEEFASRIPEREYSMAELQVFLMSHKYSPRLAVKNIDGLLEVRLRAKTPDPASEEHNSEERYDKNTNSSVA